jgi:hypothetical protein
MINPYLEHIVTDTRRTGMRGDLCPDHLVPDKPDLVLFDAGRDSHIAEQALDDGASAGSEP